MGAYATTTSFTVLLPNFLKGNSASDTAGVAMLSAHISRAENKVNAYLSTRYALPFTSVPPLIRDLSEDIACYYAIRGSYTQDGQRDNKYLDDFKEAISTLEEIRDGKTHLVLTDGTAVNPMASNRYLSSTKDYAPTFNLDTTTAWKTDSDRLSDIEDERA